VRRAAVLAAVPVVLLLAVPAAITARAGQLPEPVAGCLSAQAGAAPSSTPWAQQVLGFSSVWNLTHGGGVTVAVLDSGVDANPQFGNRVTVGPDLAGQTPGIPRNVDCAGHGTQVASIIAAAPMAGISFAGVAPKARILSIKIVNYLDEEVPDEVVSTAIRDAVRLGATVINLSLGQQQNTPELRSAVGFALANDVVVVAAAGNDVGGAKGPFYPAAYPGVLSVGAVDQDGSLAGFSDTRTPVTVTAPGTNLTSAYPGSFPDAYATQVEGTSYATAFVSGVAALVRSRYPSLTAAQVVQRIEQTADGAAGPGTGNGMINPVQAVTAVLPEDEPGPALAGTAHVPVSRAPAPDSRARRLAMAVAGGALGLAAVVILAGVVLPAGRRRRWRPGGVAPGSPHVQVIRRTSRPRARRRGPPGQGGYRYGARRGSHGRGAAAPDGRRPEADPRPGYPT
jgi:membrane-anchored mycosin MYCP